MSKVLVSFRFDEERLKELDYLASVYTHGNRTLFLERLVRRVWWLEPLAYYGKYRLKGFGINRLDRDRFLDAWKIFLCEVADNYDIDLYIQPTAGR